MQTILIAILKMNVELAVCTIDPDEWLNLCCLHPLNGSRIYDRCLTHLPKLLQHRHCQQPETPQPFSHITDTKKQIL